MDKTGSRFGAEFDQDPYPGGPKILFIGLAPSSHTHAWIDLLEDEGFNIRLFAHPPYPTPPPDDWTVRTYLPTIMARSRDHATRYAPSRLKRLELRLRRRFMPTAPPYEETLLARVIRTWQPDIIETLGVDAGKFYLRVRDRYRLGNRATWILQIRGGPDIELARHNPDLLPELRDLFQAVDQINCDNLYNIQQALEIGGTADRVASIAPVPGVGGIDIEACHQQWQGPPSERRGIVMPKSYTSPWSLVLPVFEAIKLCWERIQPCEIHMLAATDDAIMWYWDLPEAIRRHCHITRRIPRQQVFDLMTTARVMLMPSLVEGVPNSLYEAMACGAFPVVSPLETITPLVENERNVLFCRNLYPEEIANALIRAMTDDELVDAAARRNLEVVRQHADRAQIRPRVIAYYRELLERQK
jgi:glycosyltransferase involved in cell wall biosynthesis